MFGYSSDSEASELQTENEVFKSFKCDGYWSSTILMRTYGN